MIALLIEASVRASVVAGLAALLLTLVRVHSGAVRHAVWTAVLFAMVCSPLIIVWRPELPVEVPRMVSLERFVPVFEAQTSSQPAAASGPSAAPYAELFIPATATQSRPASLGSDVLFWSWPAALLSVWLVGTLVCLVHLLAGWVMSRRLLTGAIPIALSDTSFSPRAPVLESSLVSVPVVLGMMRPRIVLPSSWRAWPGDHLRAALIHEDAHAARYDLLTSFLARLNRCVFWFNPVSWWVESSITCSAEEACDDAVVRRAGEGTSYADLLVEMAAIVRARGHRVAWSAIGMTGRGRLESRIDRVLLEDTQRPVNKVRLACVVAGTTLVIGSGLGCQQQPRPLAPNAEYTASRALNEEQNRRYREMADMSREQVEALEAKAAAAPDDLESAEVLLVFYRASGQKTFGWNEMIRRRMPHLLRVIRRHPASRVAHRTLVREHDPAGYSAARALWLEQVERPDVTAAILGNAAEFFRASDKPQSETLLKRAIVLDPDGPQPRLEGNVYYPPWTSRLGSLYAQALVGATDDTTFNVVRSFSPELAKGPYADAVRKTLDATTNADVILAAGRYLLQNATSVTGKLHFDTRQLGRTYVDRAAVLAPGSINAQRLQINDDRRERNQRVGALATRFEKTFDATLAGLSDQERFELGAAIAQNLCMRAEGLYSQDPERTRAAFAVARRLAEDALRLSPRFSADDDYGTVVYTANIVLGELALKDGDRRKAVEHLRLAGASPGSRELQLTAFPQRLPTYLLAAGEREEVIAFFERLAELNSAERERWLKDAQAVRGGQMTLSYQSMFGAGG